MSRQVQFSSSRAGCDRVYHVKEDDVRVVLARLPHDATRRLRRVHFNDQSRGARVLGAVNPGRREIALCALPPRMSLTRFLARGQSPPQFGARRGTQWPTLAIRRFLLYDILLRELGGLQVVDAHARSARRKFAMETKAQAFAMTWRKTLWAQPYEHEDPVHRAPGAAELRELLGV